MSAGTARRHFTLQILQESVGKMVLGVGSPSCLDATRPAIRTRVFQHVFLWVAVQAATQRAASVLANLIIFPLAMLGGCFFPFEWMPKWMAVAGKLTPNGWALTQFKSILDGAVDSTHLGTAITLLAAFSALAFILTVRRLRSVFAV